MLFFHTPTSSTIAPSGGHTGEKEQKWLLFGVPAQQRAGVADDVVPRHGNIRIVPSDTPNSQTSLFPTLTLPGLSPQVENVYARLGRRGAASTPSTFSPTDNLPSKGTPLPTARLLDLPCSAAPAATARPTPATRLKPAERSLALHLVTSSKILIRWLPREMQPSPPARASCPVGGCSLDAGRKRAGTWLGTDIDLDQFRNTKRFKGQVSAVSSVQPGRLMGKLRGPGCPASWLALVVGAAWFPAAPPTAPCLPAHTSMVCFPYHLMEQEVAWDLGMLHIAGDAPTAGPASAAAAPVAAASTAAASGGPSPDPPDSPMLSADLAGSPMQHSQPQAGPTAQAMQHTPRSESQTPSAQAGPSGGGGGGGQASVHSAGPRSRLAVGHTPVRLSDAPGLQLHPTSPSDPALEGQTDLRKVCGVVVWW